LARSDRNRLGCQPTRNAASAGWAVTGSLGSPGSSVLAAARRSRGEELAARIRSLA
jgi:hypothetical protein